MMTSRDFCYWLQGYLEITVAGEPLTPAGGTVTLTADQVGCIQKHLALVFTHEIDPSMGGPEHQQVLHKAHNSLNRPPGVRC
jgi:hypothetical protein